MGYGRITDDNVRTIRTTGKHACGDGLFLQVTGAGAKSWLFRFTKNGRTREMGLGSARVVSLSDARMKVSDARMALLDGIDPIEVKKKLKYVRALSSCALLSSVEDIFRASTLFGVEERSGVYFLFGANKELQYVGSSKNVHRRLWDWKKKARFDIERITIQWCSESARAVLEEAYIKKLRPKYNRAMTRNEE